MALTHLDIIDHERLMENARTQGALLRRRLREAFGNHEMVGDVRGEGLLACVEFVADRAERRLFDPAPGVGPRLAGACRDEGPILRPLTDGDMLGFSPPLIVTEADVEETRSRRTTLELLPYTWPLRRGHAKATAALIVAATRTGRKERFLIHPPSTESDPESPFGKVSGYPEIPPQARSSATAPLKTPGESTRWSFSSR